jgi:hypothetical protein
LEDLSMNPGRVATPEPPSTAETADPGLGRYGGVVGNSRLTGAAGAALFVIIAVEGVTVLQIKQLISLHVFIGLLLVPLVLLKTASTGYRIARYYAGDPAYRRKGPPHPILRVTGPLVIGSSVLLLGTGIALIALGRSVGHGVLWLHQASFFVWLALMGVHVLGHLRETPTLAVADWRLGEAEHRLAGARARLALLVVSIAVGLVLGVVSLGWVGTWHHLGHLGRG